MGNKAISWALVALFSGNNWAAPVRESVFPNLWIHEHPIGLPKVASLKGDYSGFGFSVESLTLGSVTLPFPLEIPKERGEILHNPLPFYSHRGGLSEWGRGWENALRIYRYAELGEADCQGNQFASPWGK